MENIIYERAYKGEYAQTALSSNSVDIFKQAVSGGMLKKYQDAMEKIPKVIVPEYKENYEYLLQACDELVKRCGGTIRGVVNYKRWEATIDLTLPMAEFDSPEDLQLLQDMAAKSHSVTFEPTEDGGIHIFLYNLYFEELISDEYRGYIEYDAIMGDEKLAEMLGLSTEPSPEILAVAEFYNNLLDKVEDATGQDRTDIFHAIMGRVDVDKDMDNILERLEQIAQELIDEDAANSNST